MNEVKTYKVVASYREVRIVFRFDNKKDAIDHARRISTKNDGCLDAQRYDVRCVQTGEIVWGCLIPGRRRE